MIDIHQLEDIARRIRIDILEMTYRSQSGHPGPSFSIVELITTLYFYQMRIDSDNPGWCERDRFVLSKGHAAPALYSALINAGFLERKLIEFFREIDSPLQGHPSAKTHGVDATTGSLGIGLSQAVGMSLGAKRKNMDTEVYCIIGDGECDEGQIWEAALFAQHHKLNNLTVFIDHNKYQFEGKIYDILNMKPFAEKWKSFGWYVSEFNGHDFQDIIDFLNSSKEQTSKPHIGIAHTKKGFGVSFMEDNHAFHSRPLDTKDMKRAMDELTANSRK